MARQQHIGAKRIKLKVVLGPRSERHAVGICVLGIVRFQHIGQRNCFPHSASISFGWHLFTNCIEREISLRHTRICILIGDCWSKNIRIEKKRNKDRRKEKKQDKQTQTHKKPQPKRKNRQIFSKETYNQTKRAEKAILHTLVSPVPPLSRNKRIVFRFKDRP